MNKKVLVAYHMFPHYRSAIISQLQMSNSLNFSFAGMNVQHEGIPQVDIGLFNNFIEAPYKILLNKFYWQPGIIKLALFGNYDAYVYLSNPNFISTWISALIVRFRGRKVIFWGHGWLRRESKLKEIFRNSFYSISHKILVYGPRAKKIGSESGFNENKIDVVFNSLDLSVMEKVRLGAERVSKKNVFSKFFDFCDCPVIIAVSRLTETCRFDQLISACGLLISKNIIFKLVIVGDGPEKNNLQDLARENNVDCFFYGACYDENVLGPMIYHSSVAVSPGKVGLMAMHCMSYGTPVISHSDFDRQMPEAESIIEDVTGNFFEFGSTGSLASAIKRGIDNVSSEYGRNKVRQNCINEVYKNWNAKKQASIIENCINGCFD